jgi:hypothetical protein
MKQLGIKVLIILGLLCAVGRADEIRTENPMVQHPEWYIKVTEWSMYAVWSGVPIIHHVTIENTSDRAYKDVKVRVSYYSTSAANHGTLIGQEKGVLPVTLPPHTKETYLKEGFPFGAGSSFMDFGNLEVLGATPVLD